MSCLKLRDLYEYLEGGISSDQAKQIEGHLRVCTKCRRAAGERRLIAEAASGLAPFKVPEDFPERVMSRLAQSKVQSPVWRIGLAAGTSVLALIAAVVLASGKNGLELIKGVGQNFWDFIRTAVLVMAKAVSFVSLIGRALRSLFEAGAKLLSPWTSFVPPSLQVFMIVLALGILATLFFGMRKKLSIGD